jgi:transcriptional antiterminator NusG
MGYDYEIGKTYPAVNVRDIVTDRPTPPSWHCLIVAPQKENATREYFKARGMFAFYPSEHVRRTVRGKVIERERPMITQHVYVQFRNGVNWDVLKARRLIMGVYCNNGAPVVIHREVIRQLQGLPTEAELLRQAREEMMRVREGDSARILQGPLKGLIVEVGQITGQEAWLNLEAMGRIKASVSSLERITDLG